LPATSPTARPSSATNGAATVMNKRFQRGNLAAKFLKSYPGTLQCQYPYLIGR